MSTYRIIHRATEPMLGEDKQPNPFAVPIGGGYYHVEPRYVLEETDRLVAEDINDSTWSTLKKKAPKDWAAIFRMLVYRNKDNTLKAQVAKEASVVEAAKAMHDADPDSVQAVTITMSEAMTGDVVAAEFVFPHHWAYDDKP